MNHQGREEMRARWRVEREEYRARKRGMGEYLRGKYPTFFPGGSAQMEHDAGWRGLMEELARRCLEIDPGAVFRWSKEKFGGLRVHVAGSGCGGIVDEVEIRSENTCERCGAPGICDEYGGLVATRCAEHGLELAIDRDEPAMIAAWERRKLGALLDETPCGDDDDGEYSGLAL